MTISSLVESRGASDSHVLALPLAYVYARNVLVFARDEPRQDGVSRVSGLGPHPIPADLLCRWGRRRDRTALAHNVDCSRFVASDFRFRSTSRLQTPIRAASDSRNSISACTSFCRGPAGRRRLRPGCRRGRRPLRPALPREGTASRGLHVPLDAGHLFCFNRRHAPRTAASDAVDEGRRPAAWPPGQPGSRSSSTIAPSAR